MNNHFTRRYPDEDWKKQALPIFMQDLAYQLSGIKAKRPKLAVEVAFMPYKILDRRIHLTAFINIADPKMAEIGDFVSIDKLHPVTGFANAYSFDYISKTGRSIRQQYNVYGHFGNNKYFAILNDILSSR